MAKVSKLPIAKFRRLNSPSGSIGRGVCDSQ